MKTLFTATFLMFIAIQCIAQEQALEKNHQEGLDKAKKGDYIGAIASFTRAIEVLPLDPYTWYNRGMAKNMIGEYADAINDFGTCIGLKPAYGKVWYNRGLTKLYMAQYDGAIVDLSQAIQIEREYASAYYYRGYLYELKGFYDLACADYQLASEKGYKVPSEKLTACQDTTYAGLIRKPLLYLNDKATNRCYGTKPKVPIKVGNKQNMETYLRLLRSAEGKFVYYTIIDTSNLYKVELSYTNKNQEKKKTIYFDLNSYDRPKLLKGFTTFKQPLR